MKVIVTGDIAVDRAIAHTCPSNLSHWVDHTAHTFDLEGGACLVARLIDAAGRELADQTKAFSLETVGPDFTKLNPEHDDDKHITACLWEPYPKLKDQSKGPGKVWRASHYLGRNKQIQQDSTGTPGVPIVAAAMPSREAMTGADLLVLDDGNFGFRRCSEQERDAKGKAKIGAERFWPAVLDAGLADPAVPAPWILLKMSRPVAQGGLWNRLLERHADRLVVVMPIADLRLTDVRISREFSWEQTAEDLAWELVHNPRVNALSRCAHVVVFFGAAGAILVSKSKPKAESFIQPPPPPKLTFRLFFDPAVIEGDWEEGYPGKVIGGGSCLTAALALQFMMRPDQPCLEAGIHSGLDAIRTLQEEGYGQYEPKGVPVLEFPVKAVCKRMSRTARFALARHLRQKSGEDEAKRWAPDADLKDEIKSPFAEVRVQEPRAHLAHPDLAADTCVARRPWSILEENAGGSIEQLARNVVLQGPKPALNAVPLGEFKKLLTVERAEIEGFRSVRNLIAEYDRSATQGQPLSIAVFGAPGAGKSFGLTQVAESLLPDRIERLTFNLSQFSSTDDLLAALHRVRDAGLSGKLPLVFWDEFDTALGGTPLGWLRLFLAPMQDGSFQEGQISHPIGKAVFVFAGGTAHSMAAFRDRPQEMAQAFRDAKGPDFVSRLKGYVNVMGPNPCSERDLQYVVRRAILLRSLLQRKAAHLFENPEKSDGTVHIDPGLLNAFLKIGHYRHGARSMESIIDMSALSRSTRYERSSLPDEAQLELHVDSREFMARVQEVVIDPDALEKLTREAHKVYREGERARGTLRPEQDMEYGKLAPEYQEQNRENARDISTKLNLAGYIMTPARGVGGAFDFPGDDLEELAEWEHVRWMREKLARGWLYAPETDMDSRRNSCLLPWSSLPQSEKAKDRDLVNAIPKILEAAGYAVYQLPDAAQRRRKAQYKLEYHLTRVGVLGPGVAMEREHCFRSINEALKRIVTAFGSKGLAAITLLTADPEQLAAERLLHVAGAQLFVPLSQKTLAAECATFTDQVLKAGFRDLCTRADQLITPEQTARWLADWLPAQSEKGRELCAALPPEAAYVVGHCDVLIAFWDESADADPVSSRAVAFAEGIKLPLALIPVGPVPGDEAIRFVNFPLVDAASQEEGHP